MEDERNKRLIEELAMNAWPALHQNMYDGWVLRFARGFTKRSNSVTPLYESYLEPGPKVRFCEQTYAGQGLPAIFRLVDFLAPAGLDRLLEDRGYQPADLTRVMTLNMMGTAFNTVPGFREAPLDIWMDDLSLLSGTALHDDKTHRAIVAAVIPPVLHAVLEQDGEPRAAGLGVLQNRWIGLFDLVVKADHRGRGLGLQLVQGMLGWAAARGAERAYLQVVKENEPARRLYQKIGFLDSYTYWYRIKRA